MFQRSFRCVFSVRGAVRVFVVSLSLLFPLSLAAADVATLLQTPDDVGVSRGDFIRAAVKALGVQAGTTASVPYQRIPAALMPYVRAAYAKGALETFGSELYPALSISRGQALEVITALRGFTAQPHRAYRDLLGASDSLAKAVQVALDEGWMEPSTPTTFGVNGLLTGREGRLLLRKVLGEGGEEESPNPETVVPSILIRVKPLNAQPTSDFPKADILEAVWRIINDDYLYPEKVEQEEAGYAAAESLVKSLGDPYSTFYRPASSRDFQSRMNSEVSGIGAQVEDRGGVLTIVTPLPNSPAEKAGLLPGDEILSVNGESIVGLPYEEAVDKVRGPTGSTAHLKIRRNGYEFEVSVIRQTIKVPEIEVTWQEDVAIVKLLQFGKLTDTELRSIMQEIAQKEPRGVILDLRNNPGGLLHAATIVTSNFLPKGSPVVEIRSRGGNRMEVTNDDPTISADTPVVLIVNKGSASASEIVAGALQDADRATVVGEQTFGKGTVQEVLEFTDHSSLKLTIAEWFTPKGRKINGNGVKPDAYVPSSDRDEQLRRAIDLITRRMR